MGTGRKLHPELLEIADIYDTSVCPLAKVMRKELRKRGVQSLTVVYSKEEPIEVLAEAREDGDSLLAPKRTTLGSSAFVPPAAGMIIAAWLVRELASGSNLMAQL
jgi:tRNA A37 threonylcarbamoyladenosine dehydratase